MRFAILLLSAAMARAAGLGPQALRCEYLSNPEAVETLFPRLTWLVDSAERGQKQTAYRIVVASDEAALARGGADMWDTGKVESAETVNIVYAGKALEAKHRYWWKVQVWDRDGKASEWSAPARWSMGLGANDWKAQWISRRDRSPLHSGKQLDLPSAWYFRKTVELAKPVRRAVLYGSALGVFDAYVNGRRVSDAMFSPGWSDYRKRAYYRAWDVTALLTPGANALGAELADGWYAGYVGYGLLLGYGPNKSGRNFYGRTPALIAQLEIEFTDGSRRMVGTDETWKAAESPRREADIIMGESYDARLEKRGWSEPGYDDAQWQRAVAAEANGSVKAVFSDMGGDREMEFGFRRPARMQAHSGPPVRPIEEMKPRRMLEPAPGTYVFDFGQNFSGVVRLKVAGATGTTVRLRFAEMVYPGGRLMTENLRKARATDSYTLRGDAAGETWTPRFTYHGFQYVELTGFPGKPGLDAVTGVVVHSDTPLASRFESSDAMVNRVFQNVVWTQRSNFVEAPTDCPQRDERLGWTGDAQIYARAATFNADAAAFYTKWLDDLEEAQRANGAYPDYAPYPMQHAMKPGYSYGTAWMDAGIIVPWSIWQAYGDTRMLERHWRSMTRFMDFRRNLSPDFRGSDRFNQWGDWLAIGSSTPIRYIDAVYFAYTSRLMAEMAAALGKFAEAGAYRTQYGTIRKLFQQDYVKPDGTLRVETQTAYALALAQALIPPELRPKTADHLAGMIRDNGNRMTTGFLGTYPLLPVLSDNGHHDLAARLFLSREFPSWGYEVENGATTIWERWNSYTKDKGFYEPSMNSFSHYSFGAVCEWMFRRLAGIENEAPGFRKIVIRPGVPAQGLDWVNAEYRSIRGTIVSKWKRSGDRLELEVTIPANSTAVIEMPARDAASVTEGGQPVPVEKPVDGRVRVPIESGSYRLESRM